MRSTLVSLAKRSEFQFSLGNKSGGVQCAEKPLADGKGKRKEGRVRRANAAPDNTPERGQPKNTTILTGPKNCQASRRERPGDPGRAKTPLADHARSRAEPQAV